MREKQRLDQGKNVVFPRKYPQTFAYSLLTKSNTCSNIEELEHPLQLGDLLVCSLNSLQLPL